ncbi:MAG: hypothetical protein HS132_14600 [Planctomycetia bacterium]|nr:hypothetical protein [Planctomycetia bacterium]
MNFPEDLLYTKTHEWVKKEEKINNESGLYQRHKLYGGVNNIRLKLNVEMINFVLFNTKLMHYEKGKV